jgi:ABC exporter DevB family membrane fusion protein
MTRFAIVAAGVLLVGFLGLMIDAQSRIPVERPERQVGPHLIFAQGRVEGATPQVELRFELAGRIEEILVAEGQIVQKGDVLGRIDDAEYRYDVALAAAEVDLAEAQLDRLLNGARPEERAEARALYSASQAELERARLTWDRTQQLRNARAVSQQDADDQRTRVLALTWEVEAAKSRLALLEAPARADEVAMAQARIDAAKAQVQLAHVQLERTSLRAPSAGQILRVNVEDGELTGPDSPEPAIVMVDTTKFQVRTFVEELDAPRVQVGMPATITADGLTDQKLTGVVTRVSPRMSPKSLLSDDPTERYDTKTREVWIELEDATDLVVGLRVDVSIVPKTPTEGGTGTAESVGIGALNESRGESQPSTQSP